MVSLTFDDNPSRRMKTANIEKAIEDWSPNTDVVSVSKPASCAMTYIPLDLLRLVDSKAVLCR